MTDTTVPSKTPNEVLDPIKMQFDKAKDSVRIITEITEEIAAGKPAKFVRKHTINMYVEYLKSFVSKPEIVDSGEDLTEFQAGIALGEEKLAEIDWLPTNPETVEANTAPVTDQA